MDFNIIFQIKYKGLLIVTLKSIKSRKNIFYYLSFYLHYSFFSYFIIIIFIYCIIKSLMPKLRYQKILLILLRY